MSEKKKKTNKKKSTQEKRHFILEKIPYLILIIALLIIYARYVGTKGITVRDYNITSTNIPSSFDGFTIVQFSDLKYGSTVNMDDLDKLVKKINDLNPDVVVFTGDLISPNYKLEMEEKEKITQKLSLIDPLIGKYSVRGNEDNSSSNYDYIINTSNFKDISNSYDLIYYKGLTPIVIYGLDSLINKKQDFKTAFAYPDENVSTDYMATYRILLAHEPDTIEKVKNYNISLMLSGHSLNSSINIPFIKNNYNIKGASTYYDDEYNVGQTKLYVSSGLGTNKYHLRINSRPSISVYRLYTK